jgi:hypothetical protein
MLYKRGDLVQVKSKVWYEENKDADGYVGGTVSWFRPDMVPFCGKNLVVGSVDKGGMCMGQLVNTERPTLGDVNGIWDDSMIEKLVGCVSEEELNQRHSNTMALLREKYEQENYGYGFNDAQPFTDDGMKEVPETIEALLPEFLSMLDDSDKDEWYCPDADVAKVAMNWFIEFLDAKKKNTRNN